MDKNTYDLIIKFIEIGISKEEGSNKELLIKILKELKNKKLVAPTMI